MEYKKQLYDRRKMSRKGDRGILYKYEEEGNKSAE